MSIRVANIRLELGEPEEGLPEKIAGRLGLAGRRRSLELADPPQEPRRPQPRRHPLHLLRPRSSSPSGSSRGSTSGATSGHRAVHPGAVRVAGAGHDARCEHRPVIVGAGPAGLFAGYLLARVGLPAADPGAGPGRQGPGRRRPPVRRERAARPREQLPLRRGRCGHVQRRQAHLAAARAPTSAASWRSSPTATASRRSSTSTGRTSARTGCRWSSGPCGASSRRWAARSGFPAGSRTSTSPTAGSAGLRRRRATSPPTWRSWRSATAPATPTGCCSAAACRSRPSRSSSASGSSSRRRRSTGPDTGTTPATPPSGAADYSASVRAGRRDLFTFCMCAGGYVMPSVSDPGYFCTNGMSESRHDSPFANSGLVVTIEPDETGSDHPLAGVHYQQRYRAAGVPRRRARRTRRRSSGPAISSPAGPAGARSRPAIGAAAGPLDLGLFLPDPVVEALEHGLPTMDRRFGGQFLRDATLTGPESRGSSPVRILRDPADPREPGRRRALSLRRGGRLRRRDHQRRRRRPADGPRDRGRPMRTSG